MNRRQLFTSALGATLLACVPRCLRPRPSVEEVIRGMRVHEVASEAPSFEGQTWQFHSSLLGRTMRVRCHSTAMRVPREHNLVERASWLCALAMLDLEGPWRYEPELEP